MHVVYICINELRLYNSSNFALHYNYNYYKLSFKTLTQRWTLSLFQFYRKNVLTLSVDPKQKEMSNFHFDLYIFETFPRGGAWLFRGGAKFSGEVQNNLSAHPLQNPAMVLLVFFRYVYLSLLHVTSLLTLAQTVPNLFKQVSWVRSENRTHDLRGGCSDNCATEAPT